MLRGTLSLIAFVMIATLVPNWTTVQGALAQTVTAHGCQVRPAQPINDHGQLVATATVHCPTDMAGRYIVIELRQQVVGSDHVYEPVWGAAATLEVPETLDAGSEAESNPVACRAIDGERRFQTVVTIGDANGHFEQNETGSRRLPFDCLEGDQT